MSQIFVGGGDDPDVQLYGLGPADPQELSLLDDAEKLGLKGDGYLADLIQQDDPRVGYFEESVFSRAPGSVKAPAS